MGPIEQMAPETWHKMIEVTLTGTYHLVNMIVPYMKQQRWGRIVNIASRTGMVGGAKMAHYSAAKAGLIGLTKALAKELGPSGILVNAIAPTTILTPKERERLTPERQEKLIAQIPLGRIATPGRYFARGVVSGIGHEYIRERRSDHGGGRGAELDRSLT